MRRLAADAHVNVESTLEDHLHTDSSSSDDGVPAVPAAPSESAPETPRVPAQAGPVESELTDRERQVLAFERRWWRHAGAKEQAIRDIFGISATRYYQILNGLLDNPAALAADPVLVNRLRRLRAARVRTRRR
jgi:hypothetical protein